MLRGLKLDFAIDKLKFYLSARSTNVKLFLINLTSICVHNILQLQPAIPYHRMLLLEATYRMKMFLNRRYRTVLKRCREDGTKDKDRERL